MSIKYKLDYSEIVKLQNKISQLPDVMEDVINDTLHTDGAEITIEEITKFIPVSTFKNRMRKKKHAKTSNWSKVKNDNLGFTITTKGGAAKKKGSFGYLVFPNEGRGPSNPVEQRFMEKGLEKATPRIMNRLNERIDKKLEEALN